MSGTPQQGRPDVRAQMIRQGRRTLMRILLEAYPYAFDGVSIFSLLLESFPKMIEDDLHRDLAYLLEDDKGYLETEGPTVNVHWINQLYKLTGAGNEIANRLVTDAALDV